MSKHLKDNFLLIQIALLIVLFFIAVGFSLVVYLAVKDFQPKPAELPKPISSSTKAVLLVNNFFISENSATLTASELKILAFGDIMLDRNVFSKVKKMNDYTFPFLKVDDFLKDADFKIANLEGPITDFLSKAVTGGALSFTFSPKFIEPLKNRFNILSLANNHTLDRGEAGFSQTAGYLKNNNIIFFGSSDNRAEGISQIIEKNGIKIGVIGYNGLRGNYLNLVISKIKELKKNADFIIIYPHWGEEYKKLASTKQKQEAKTFIDNGADLIIGSHPHVMEPVEIYKNKIIFYSLGNFIFDQYFSRDTMEGLAVAIFLNKEDSQIVASYELYPYKINKDSQPELADKNNKERILKWLSENSLVAEAVKNKIKEGKIEFNN